MYFSVGVNSTYKQKCIHSSWTLQEFTPTVKKRDRNLTPSKVVTFLYVDTCLCISLIEGRSFYQTTILTTHKFGEFSHLIAHITIKCVLSHLKTHFSFIFRSFRDHFSDVFTPILCKNNNRIFFSWNCWKFSLKLLNSFELMSSACVIFNGIHSDYCDFREVKWAQNVHHWKNELSHFNSHF